MEKIAAKVCVRSISRSAENGCPAMLVTPLIFVILGA
jgi:hypothetical protein